jgi:hypothetical protein
MAFPMMGYILSIGFSIYVHIFNEDTMNSHQNTELNFTVPVGKDIALEEGPNGKFTDGTVETVEDTRHNT